MDLLQNHSRLHVDEIEKLNGAPVRAPPTPLACRGLLHQVLTAAAADVSSIGLGLVFGYSAVALPQLEHPDSWLVVDKEQASWIASLAALSLSVGCVVSGVLMERCGRRTTLQLQCIPSALGWVLIASATDVPQLYAGRLLTGLGGGMVDSACQVYLSEISSPSVRGAISASNPLCFTFGVLVAYIMGWCRLSWPALAAASTLAPVLGFVALCFVPESPTWLVARGKGAQAERALSWLRGGHNTDEQISFGEKTGLKEMLHSLTSRHAVRPFIILLIFFVFQQFCGMNAVVFYAVSMFHTHANSTSDDTSSGLDSNQSAVVIGVTRFLMTALTCVLLARLGRRPMSLVSGLGISTSMFTLGTAIYVQGEPSPSLVLFCLVVFIASNTVGYFAIPWVMLGELLPEKCRGLASGLVSAIVYTFVFVVVKTYPMLHESLGQAGVFWGYGTVAIVGFVFVLTFLPETHNKTLLEIEASFRKA